MKRFWFAPLCLLAAVAQADVYKWVDEAGNVHYGDLPPSADSAEKLKLPEVTTYEAPPAQAARPAAAPTEDEALSTGYQSLAITQPTPGSTLRSNQNTVQVSVALEPSLRAGDLMTIYLDGQSIGPGVPGTQIELHGVFRGRHSVQAKVVNAQGEVLLESQVVHFFLRQASVLNRPAPPPTQ